MTSYKS